MILNIKNIGKFESAKIDIKGLTVIAGINSTGKSTISKVLYCMLNGFLFDENEYIKDKRKSLVGCISRLFTRRYFGEYYDFIGEFADRVISKLLKVKQASVEAVSFVIYNEMKKFGEEKAIEVSMTDLKENIDEIVNDVVDILNVNANSFIGMKLLRVFGAEFKGQILNINIEDKIGEIQLSIKGKELKVVFGEDGLSGISAPFFIKNQTAYLDDPYVIDDPYRYRKTGLVSRFNHRDVLCRLIMKDRSDSIIDGFMWNEKSSKILNKIKKVCNGELKKMENGRLTFLEGNNKRGLDVVNVSTGMKTFIIVNQLLKNGVILENGTLILDEPEIHLHPSWQLVLAEILVLFQKEFNLHILLTSHSPYFINAIQVYSGVYDINDTCKFYHVTSKNDYSIVEDVTNNVENIYAEMAKPFQYLEDVKYNGQ